MLYKVEYKVEIVTEREGLEPLVWRLFPGMVPVTQSEWFCIYSMRSPQPLTDFLRGTLEGWIETGIIVAFHYGEQEEEEGKTAYVSTSEAAEISGHAEITWRKWAADDEVPGSFKAGERAWMIPRAYAESKIKPAQAILKAQGPGPAYVEISRMADPRDERNHMLLSSEQEEAYQQALVEFKSGNVSAAHETLKKYFDWTKLERIPVE